MKIINKDWPLLHNFSFDGGKEKFDEKLRYLKIIAEDEKWGDEVNPFFILRNYIIYTFDFAYKHENILYNKNRTKAICNTGLLTESFETIYIFFTKSREDTEQEWYLNTFLKDSDRKLDDFADRPEINKYFDDPSTLYFDPTKDVRPSIEHIFHDNKERIPSEVISLETEIGQDALIRMIKTEIDFARERIKRNQRLVVPMYYRDRITYLLPIRIKGKVIPVAVEDVNGNFYRANTILTTEMAYMNARLIIKPEVNWLLNF
jgi:hypothetical protein